MKKVLALVLALVMVFSTSVTALAAEPALSFSYEQEEGSNTLVVKINTSNLKDEKINCVQFTLEYDADKLLIPEDHELFDENGDPVLDEYGDPAIKTYCYPGAVFLGKNMGDVTINTAIPGKVYVVWDHEESYIKKDGELLIIEFTVKAPGEVEFGFNKEDDFIFAAIDGTFVNVTEDEETLTGKAEFVHDHEGGIATCKAKAICKICGEEYGDLLDHTEAIDSPVDATCTETGLTEGKHCSVCGEIFVEQTVVPALGHTEGEKVTENVVAATCGTDGSHDEVVYCSVCGEELSRETVVDKATGEHVYVNEVEKVEPTCTEDGYVVKACGCGATKKTVLPALGHTEAIDSPVDATCTETGLTEGRHCSVCGEVIVAQKVVPALGHTGGTATCEAKAVCEVCGEEYGELGEHKGGVANCGMPAQCEVCESYYGDVDPDNHVGPSIFFDSKEATCTEDGYTGEVQCACGLVLEESVVIPALGHTEGEKVTENVVAATCGTDGSHDEVVYCSVCGEELSRENVVDKATGEHVYVTEVEKVEPTCTEDGYVIKACGCGATKKTVLTALGHTADKAVNENEVAATCTTDGSYDSVVYCSVCGEELSRETVVVKALGHDYKYETVKEPSCTETGERKVTCSRCDYENTESIGTLEHDWSAWKVIKNPTSQETGLSQRVCARCNETETKIIPKLTYNDDKPNPGVTIITPNSKPVGETNPNTGAGSIVGLVVLAAISGCATVVSSKKKHK